MIAVPNDKRKIAEYQIIEGEGFIEQKVNDELKEGWELYGSPFFLHVVNCGTYAYQAMVKYEKS